MRREASLPAHAKINLRLVVLAREATGYHGIETLFQRVGLADDVRVAVDDVGAARTIDCQGFDAGPGERNLAYRAALAYADAVGWPAGFAIEIDKCIPVGGGLGGGSADAGAVLRLLDGLSPTPIGSAIYDIAAQIGSDVPFLTQPATLALAWGRGERLLALPTLPVRHVALIFPDFPIATADAYGWLAQSRAGHHPDASVLETSGLTSWSGIESVAINDFENVVGARHPTIPGLIEKLKQAGARIALLSGSGSSVFGIFDDAATATAAIASTGERGTVTSTLAVQETGFV